MARWYGTRPSVFLTESVVEFNLDRRVYLMGRERRKNER